ncbi:MAG TPA: MarR family transcriptional regulator [Aquabacterium sp.]|uniref:MarR family winged helix-turn-helix transcriptional regulator n=1 Tax=Aquabacterium sp. TaxID=1872578 RepID=UPI002E3089B5|nr:MarR family transcriptional regulator [Aquabacterium sp.]HEX5355933.1 MarR family transcriptional regulator [Aquabacterium sp.]
MTDSSTTSNEAPEGPTPPAPIYIKGNWKRENSFGYLMRRVVQMMVGVVDKRLDSHGLTQAQWTPMFMISKGECNTLAALSRELQLDAGALTRTLDRLEAKGLCKRVRSTEDRRVVHLSLTEEGETAIAPVPGVLCDVSNALLEGFTQEEWQTLMVLLRRILANAENLRDAAEAERHA